MSAPLDLTKVTKAAKDKDPEVTVLLLDKTGEPYIPEATVTVVGTYSKAYRAAQERQTARVLGQRRLRKPTAAEVLAQTREITAACIVGWSGIVSGKTSVACTEENKLALLEAAPWIQEQVEEAMRGQSDFIKSNSKGS
jgi:hypothetical protein